MAESNPNSRLEAFCDGVFAIALTLLIIDIKIPPSASVANSAELWGALGKLGPSVFAFVLSFTIILITWVNHHATLKLVGKSSPAFIYANGFLLLTVVVMPFPSALMGEYLLTDHATPAVVLFNGVIALQAVAWIAVTGAALKNKLATNAHAIRTLRTNRNSGFYALGGYVVLGVLALWYPFIIAVMIALLWGFWLIYGIRIKHE